jgi:serine/threonine-protein kinase
MIVADLEDEPETRARFLREATVTANLEHANIVRVVDAGEDAGRLFIAMELLSGLPLRTYLRAHPALPTSDRLNLIRGLCAGLQIAHHHQVVHRDVNPGNLFITDNGTLKILDFGLARLHTSTLTANGQVVGTLDFMAPEQAQGQKADHRADIFSAAAVSSLVLTGHSPFARGDIGSTMNALLNEPPDFGTLRPSEAIVRVLEHGLAKHPEARYQSITELGDALADAAARR